MLIEQIKGALPTLSDGQDICSLLGELGGDSSPVQDTAVFSGKLESILRDPDVMLFAGREENGRIVACACLCIMETLSGRKGHIEDVVVSGECRGRGYGRQMMEHLIATARECGPLELFLTSRPSRTAANALYQSLGFVRKETNCYRMKI